MVLGESKLGIVVGNPLMFANIIEVFSIVKRVVGISVFGKVVEALVNSIDVVIISKIVVGESVSGYVVGIVVIGVVEIDVVNIVVILSK